MSSPSAPAGEKAALEIDDEMYRGVGVDAERPVGVDRDDSEVCHVACGSVVAA